MARFITLAGRKQVGKDTAAEYFKKTLESRSQRVHVTHFADALKEACSVIFGIPLEDMETETGKRRLTDVRWPKDVRGHYEGMGGPHEHGVWIPDASSEFMTVREVLQFVGTDLFRNQMDPDIWVQSVYRKKYRDDDIVIVADCRFPNEAEFAKEHGLLIGVMRETRLACDGHKSETALDDYQDYHHAVDNNGSFAELYVRLFTILEHEGFVA